MESIIEYRLTEEQLALQKVVREFVRREVAPQAGQREWISSPQERFPWDWVEKLSKMGIRTMTVPREYGGPGADTITACVIGEELSAGDLGLGVIFDQVWKFVPLITTACSDEQRSRYLPAFLGDDRYLIAVGLHEDTAGSDHFLPYNVPPHGAKASAVRASDGSWLLNGAKTYISNGGVAKLNVILARTQPGTGGVDGLGAFFVELGAPGFTIGRIENKCGQRLVQNGELIFENVRVPAEDVLGDPLSGLSALREHLRGRGMPEAAATTLGVARAAFEAALEHARTHVQGGTNIINHDIIALMLAEMELQLETARQLIWRAAWAADHGETVDLRLPPMAKEYASEVAVNVCIRAMEIFGGAGIMMELPMQKYIRDALTFLHSEGTNQIMRLRRANLLRGGPRPPF
ncbi:MAG: acyl-CoA dehydrogenase family protein [Dehalococcoidia bacterium]|nr:acyl-CoA dehydrogenase family protein [Dehalococcoidia bacterium]